MHKFWFVWNPAGRAPSHKHESKTSAHKEAERLAEANPTQIFVVLESIGHCRTRKPVEFTKHAIAQEEMSFEHNGDNWEQEQIPF
jgi:DNA-binding GntR family transcriptional regulator